MLSLLCVASTLNKRRPEDHHTDTFLTPGVNVVEAPSPLWAHQRISPNNSAGLQTYCDGRSPKPPHSPRRVQPGIPQLSRSRLRCHSSRSGKVCSADCEPRAVACCELTSLSSLEMMFHASEFLSSRWRQGVKAGLGNFSQEISYEISGNFWNFKG